MKIHHRGLYPNRFDAPYGIGTLIWAKSCKHHCPGCFHQDKFDIPIYEEDVDDILDKIEADPFSTGIVLGGFEWTEQEDELYALLDGAVARNLQVILYTHYTIEALSTKYPELLTYKGIYVKCGEYDESCLSATYTSYGIPLASTNQRIYLIGADICRGE